MSGRSFDNAVTSVNVDMDKRCGDQRAAYRAQHGRQDSRQRAVANRNGTRTRSFLFFGVRYRLSFMLRPSHRQLKNPVTHRSGGGGGHWSSGPVWTFCRRKKHFAAVANRTPDRAAGKTITVLTELSRALLSVMTRIPFCAVLGPPSGWCATHTVCRHAVCRSHVLAVPFRN